MAWVESLQRAIDYTEEHLLDSLTIDDIARQANVSVFHFQRIFAVLTDTTVGEYIRRRRLTLAAEELSRTSEKIIDLAFKYGYDTPEAFTKAFRRQHGVSPSEVRKGLGKLQSYNRLTIQVSLKGVEPVKYSIVEKEAFEVIGIRREYSVLNNENLIEIPKLWEEVNRNGISSRLSSLNNDSLKGVLGVCVDNSDTESRKINYWIGTAYKGERPGDLLSMEIPASKWAVFEVHGPMPEAMQKTWEKIFTEWFPSSGYKHAGTPELEVYPDDDAYQDDYYSEIWIPVI
ncbi:AraC family transcriptional regulator [Bacillus sp. FJAT-49736]|uniref:AraC family transcriptional regulator n=1 Tax=Bacillus sp. FJAT-49736 TaxID=2833582 RepID=UPI001BC91676|nr:AraC family transcriptional regulator [Bacillus sp. FJAT-49736]MBS4174735.1 AraC family transcriptional regulator [Bacillus sp. FJAT-49736]